jgi:ATP-dependent DNA helicase RecG
LEFKRDISSFGHPVGSELLAELQRSILTLSFDQQALPDLSKKALDMSHVQRAFKNIDKKIDEKKLRSLGVLVPVAHQLVPSVGGLILFGHQAEREQSVPDARVSCARFLSETKTTILDRYEMEGSILDAVSEVPKFIARNTRLAAQIQEIRRRDIPEYPMLAVREALINALAHADYSLGGSHIQIAIFNNRLEIQNPGMLPFGFTMEDLKTGVSRVRNRVIARVFHELQFMEEWGSGYKRIIEVCEKEGYPEPKWEELGTAIRVTFYPHPQTRLVEEETSSFHEEFLDREKAIVSLFKKGGNLAFREIFKRLSPGISERTLRYDLVQLKRKGVLISKGKGRAMVWQKKGKGKN